MAVSCLYEGTVRHRRTRPAVSFRHPIALFYLDLDELPRLLGGRLVSHRPGLLRFRRSDYLGDASIPLSASVRELVGERTGRRPEGPIRILTAVRTFGTCFNPVSFVYCFDRSGERVETVLAEVTNTPWGERHVYLLDGAESPSRVVTGRFDKALHVSPFMGMDHEYTCRASRPGETLSVHIESARRGEPGFDATLALRRIELTPAAARRHLARYPFGSARTLALIYAGAARLRLRGARYFPHPAMEPR